MKAKELRERSDQELSELAAQLRKELFQNRMKNATGQLSDTSSLKKTKTTLARIKAIAGERSLSAAAAKSAAAKSAVATSAVATSSGSEA
jgi:large subunit ribosomal protein L29